MKKTLSVLFAGIAAGALVAWLGLRHADTKDEPAAEPEKKSAEAKHDGSVQWSREQQTAAGLTVAPAKAVAVRPELKGFGRVLDASGLALALADIRTALAPFEASTREFERLKRLHAQDGNASARALETAEAALRRDIAAVATAKARLAAAWGPALAGRTDIEVLSTALLEQKAALVRVDLDPGETLSTNPGTVRFTTLPGDTAPGDGEVLGPAPSADPQVQSAALLTLVRTNGLVPGTVLTAHVPSAGGAAEKGVLLDRGAILRHEGEAFVWVQAGDDRFERRRVVLGRSLAEGILALDGVKEGDRVVVTAGQQLLSDELKPTGGEE
jgi:hypothetical protein